MKIQNKIGLNMAENNSSRLAELDWLRVILILAVFLHHVLMPFNGDNWHIMNNQSSKILDDIMVYFEQFRLPILFFISGVGATILLKKQSAKAFSVDKIKRLLVPLLIGIVLIVPPQTYIENITAMGAYWQEYPKLAQNFSSNHLWFIEYLIVFAVLALPVNWLLNSHVGKKLITRLSQLSQAKLGLLSIVIVLVVLRIVCWINFPDNDNKIENLTSSSYYFFFFIAGMLFIREPSIWQAIGKQRLTNLMVLIISTVVFYAYYYSPDLSPYFTLETRWSIWWLVCSLVAWSALLAVLGYAQHYLNQSSQWLKESNELIYPFYIFHQTVIVVVGYWVISTNLSIVLKASILLLLSLLITSLLCWFFIRPFNLMRYMFGLKPTPLARKGNRLQHELRNDLG
jgi:glucans biosynthesis protein C